MDPQTMTNSIVLYGTSWCPDCRRSKRFLDEHQVPYVNVDIEQDDRAAAYIQQLNHGKRVIPTIVFPDGSVLFEPSNAELSAKLGLQAKAA